MDLLFSNFQPIYSNVKGIRNIKRNERVLSIYVCDQGGSVFFSGHEAGLFQTLEYQWIEFGV